MSDRPARVIIAKSPGKRSTVARYSASPSRPATPPRPSQAAAVGMSSGPAIAAFLALLTGWKLAPARGWRMLTGQSRPVTSLTPDQITRVQHLLAIDAGMRSVQGGRVGEWMVRGNGAAVTSGQAPVEFLTRAGTVGYAALARHVGEWAAL